jgi:hypothetical protein
MRITVDARRRINQRRPEVLAGARRLHQVHARRTAIHIVFVGDIPFQVGRWLPQHAQAGSALILGTVLGRIADELVRVDRLEGDRLPGWAVFHAAMTGRLPRAGRQRTFGALIVT